MTYLNTICPITNKPIRLFAECSPMHLKQVARQAITPQDAVAIAESRYKQSIALRKERGKRQTARREQLIADAIECDDGYESRTPSYGVAGGGGEMPWTGPQRIFGTEPQNPYDDENYGV